MKVSTTTSWAAPEIVAPCGFLRRLRAAGRFLAFLLAFGRDTVRLDFLLDFLVPAGRLAFLARATFFFSQPWPSNSSPLLLFAHHRSGIAANARARCG